MFGTSSGWLTEGNVSYDGYPGYTGYPGYPGQDNYNSYASYTSYNGYNGLQTSRRPPNILAACFQNITLRS